MVEIKTTPKGYTDRVSGVEVTPDGRLLAVSVSWDQTTLSVLYDQTLRLWDLETGETIASFPGEGYVGNRTVTSAVQPIFAGDELGRVYFLQLVEADETKPSPGEVKIPLLLRQE